MSLLPVEDALQAILARVPAVTSEQVPLNQANGRVLAAPVIAGHDQPPFDASAMDGYAMRAEDVHDGALLRVIGVSQAGAGYGGGVHRGEAARIFTGGAGTAGCRHRHHAGRGRSRWRFRPVHGPCPVGP